MQAARKALQDVVGDSEYLRVTLLGGTQRRMKIKPQHLCLAGGTDSAAGCGGRQRVPAGDAARRGAAGAPHPARRALPHQLWARRRRRHRRRARAVRTSVCCAGSGQHVEKSQGTAPDSRVAKRAALPPPPSPACPSGVARMQNSKRVPQRRHKHNMSCHLMMAGCHPRGCGCFTWSGLEPGFQ